MNNLNRSLNLAVRLRAGSFIALLTLGDLLAVSGPAQTFTVLHSFTAANPTNSDGVGPNGLILSGNTLYGTTQFGGDSGQGAIMGNGTVFAIQTDGTGFTNLHSFSAASLGYINTDGVSPSSSLILSGNTLYGTASAGGISGSGTVFAVKTDGTGFTKLHDGSGAVGWLLLGDTLYGAGGAGSFGSGAVFALKTDGTGFTNLYNFSFVTNFSYLGFQTNSDGYDPSGLVLSGNTLYGATGTGGSEGGGTVFALNIDGSSFTNLHRFTSTAVDGHQTAPNSDGAFPNGLILSGDTLYGTATLGGTAANGTVFSLKTNGTGFTILHYFTELSAAVYAFGTNDDGAWPYATLVLSGNTLYGTTYYGGPAGCGTVFAVNTDGTGFTTMHSFTGGSDGVKPLAGLVLSGNTLYGTAIGGGSSGNGTVFSLAFTPQLSITPAGTNVILSWPTNFAGFDYTGYKLQSTTNLGSSAIWGTNPPPPVVVNGQLTVTNPIAAIRQFFRLSQ